MTAVAWIPGWASDFALWSERIAEEFPGLEHRFVGYPELIAHSAALSRIETVASADVLVAWSLGSLLVALDPSLAFSAQRIALVAPVVDFCAENAGWPRWVLSRMQSRLASNAQGVLQEFARTMSDERSPNVFCDRETWMSAAVRYPVGLLSQGLECLASLRASERAGLHTRLSHVGPRLLLANRTDPVCPAAQTGLAAKFWGVDAEWLSGPGHWPLASASARIRLADFF